MEKIPVKKETRLSDASTADLNFSSDDEIDLALLKEKTDFPCEISGVFNCLSEGTEILYLGLSEKLQSIYSILEEQLEPVCLRDDLCLAPNSVNLTSILSSRLCRRRTTMPAQSTTEEIY